ncbi:MAG: EcsC family protein [Oscillospiraceae bacterium]|nr:EcsC family protein [Oscillospiraceae bacterium]
MAELKRRNYQKAIDKELNTLRKREEALEKRKLESKPVRLRSQLESKVPDKVYKSLKLAFGKAFGLIFDKGSIVIEKTYNQEGKSDDYLVREYAFRTKANRKALKELLGSAGSDNLKSVAFTTAEGVLLGAFGVGIPDIVVFVGVLLRGVYETALNYGFDYQSDEERYFILKLMEVSMLKGEEWSKGNKEIDEMISDKVSTPRTPADIKLEIEKASDAIAIDMLLLKFIQGFPVVGIIGGSMNPVYYNKVMRYAELKYRKRRLLLLSQEQSQ